MSGRPAGGEIRQIPKIAARPVGSSGHSSGGHRTAVSVPVAAQRNLPPAEPIVTQVDHGSATSQQLVRKSAREQLMISACGRTIGVDESVPQTLLGLQAALQHKLQMEAQTFHFFDINGNSLVTDAQVMDAVDEGMVPLVATLTDASIHYIENRREELAQMQWKLVRDQMTGTTCQVAQTRRQVTELSEMLVASKSELQAALDRSKNEMLRVVDEHREIASSEFRQLAERVTAVAQLVTGERNKREISMQSLDKQLQNLRDSIDAERAARRQDQGMHLADVSDLKALIEGEKCAREAFEDRHSFDLHGLNERMDQLSSRNIENLQDQAAAFKKQLDTVSSAAQEHASQVVRMRAESDTIATEQTIRFQDVEDRCVVIETRMAEVASRQAASLERLCERQERVAQAVESLRLEEKQQQHALDSALQRVKQLEGSIHAAEGEARELVQQERNMRETLIRRTTQALTADHSRQMGELEKKLGARLERESEQREMNVKSIVQEVSKTVDRAVSIKEKDGKSSCSAPSVASSKPSVVTSNPPPPAVLPFTAGGYGPMAVQVGLAAPGGSMAVAAPTMQPVSRTSTVPAAALLAGPIAASARQGSAVRWTAAARTSASPSPHPRLSSGPVY
eukprot:TRINITY_DN30067_c0_g5_i1.p1 TRINITY_DN30067_c0_g5~~TRINITY_DN30067_c0_g5_i1.p1  ORF type:complete len:625 (+),score=177.50 TRINITY_DN30067_c0_g5_i1:117-1991(+)